MILLEFEPHQITKIPILSMNNYYMPWEKYSTQVFLTTNIQTVKFSVQFLKITLFFQMANQNEKPQPFLPSMLEKSDQC